MHAKGVGRGTCIRLLGSMHAGGGANTCEERRTCVQGVREHACKGLGTVHAGGGEHACKGLGNMHAGGGETGSADDP